MSERVPCTNMSSVAPGEFVLVRRGRCGREIPFVVVAVEGDFVYTNVYTFRRVNADVAVDVRGGDYVAVPFAANETVEMYIS